MAGSYVNATIPKRDHLQRTIGLAYVGNQALTEFCSCYLASPDSGLEDSVMKEDFKAFQAMLNARVYMLVHQLRQDNMYVAISKLYNCQSEDMNKLVLTQLKKEAN